MGEKKNKVSQRPVRTFLQPVVRIYKAKIVKVRKISDKCKNI